MAADVSKKMTVLPYFMRGSYSSLEYALTEGAYKDLDRDAYVFIEDTGMFAYVEKNKTIHLIKTSNIVASDELPDTGNTETLYLVKGVVYTFDGDKFVPTYQNVSDEVETLSQELQRQNEEIEKIKAQLDGFDGMVDEETGEEISVQEYVDIKNEQVFTQAQDYVDNALTITII